MKAFFTFVMRGRLQAVASAVALAALALLLTPVAIASTAVVGLTTLRQGWREGLLVAVGSTLALILVGAGFGMPAVVFGVLGVSLWGPIWLLTGILGKTGSLRLALEAAAVAAALVVVTQYLLIADPTAFWTAVLENFLGQWATPEVLADDNRQAMVAQLAGWMPGGLAATWFMGTALALMLSGYADARLRDSQAYHAAFRELRFGRWILWLVPVLLLLGVILTKGEPSFAGQLYLIGMVVFLIQGVSMVHGMVALHGAPQTWLLGLYLVLILFPPNSATVIAAAGYIDGWLDFRAKARARLRSKTDG